MEKVKVSVIFAVVLVLINVGFFVYQDKLNTKRVKDAVVSYFEAHKSQLKGDQGIKGEAGAVGATGEQGTAGSRGSTGTAGATGSSGARGSAGLNGCTWIGGSSGYWFCP